MVVRAALPGALSDTLSDDEVDRLFRALADATRRDIVRRTLLGEASVSALAADYDMSFAAVQKHVAVLEGVGLVTKHARGRERIVRGNAEQIGQARALLVQLEELWRGRVSRLDALLAEPEYVTSSTNDDTDPITDEQD
jgi:DNA-binding transcriptional ArsR family regulator